MGSIKSDILFDVFFNSLFVKFLFYSFHGARSFILNILSQYDFKYPRTFRVYQHRAAASASSGASDWSHWNAFAAPLAAPNRSQIHFGASHTHNALNLALDAWCVYTLTHWGDKSRKEITCVDSCFWRTES